MEPFPLDLHSLLAHPQEPEAFFMALLPVVCDRLQSDRCFLDVRNPYTRLYRNFCWGRRPDYPDLTTPGWQAEQPWEREDPLFAAALRLAPSIFVEDVTTAPPEVLNLDFEQQNFGHRALIHAHIVQDGQLWGILQPCLFHHPRLWSTGDRALIDQLTQSLAPIVTAYVQQATAPPTQELWGQPPVAD